MHAVTAHQLQAIKTSPLDFSPGLVQPKRASRVLSTFVRDCLDLTEDVEVLSARTARHSPISTSMVGDVILMNNQGVLEAGQVWAFAKILDETFAVVQMFAFNSRNAAESTAIYRILDKYDFTPINEIIDSAIFNEYEPGRLKVVMPLDIDSCL